MPLRLAILCRFILQSIPKLFCFQYSYTNPRYKRIQELFVNLQSMLLISALKAIYFITIMLKYITFISTWCILLFHYDVFLHWSGFKFVFVIYIILRFHFVNYPFLTCLKCNVPCSCIYIFCFFKIWHKYYVLTKRSCCSYYTGLLYTK